MKSLKRSKNNPLTSPNPLFKFNGTGALDLVVRRDFDPFSLYNYCSPEPGEHFFAGVAQLVEQLIRNQQVSGSSPLAGFLIEIKRVKPIYRDGLFLIPENGLGPTPGQPAPS